MRVVGGRLKGRNLASPSSRDIRPTADRLREAIFNILIHAYDDPIADARVLDLFAGTGALGIEAVSRGAKFTLFVDNGAEARALMRDNVETLGLGGVTKVYRRDATNLGPAHPMEPFSLVFLDPPYAKGLADKALVSLRDDLGHDEHDVKQVVTAVLQKLPDEHDIRAIDLDRELHPGV